MESISCTRLKTFNPKEAANITDTILYPTNQHKQRMKIARDAQFKEEDDESSTTTRSIRNLERNLISANDPRLSFTYDEFPLHSMDLLLDLALGEYNMLNTATEEQERQPNVLVDLGSGCGRLVLHAALCSYGHGDNTSFQHIHGIEISKELHDIGKHALGIGVEHGFFHHLHNHPEQNKNNKKMTSTVQLHCGAANELSNILGQADIIFAYSTAFDTKGFDETLGAMILTDEWSMMLAHACRKGSIVVTTDRALDPNHGWELRQRLDVDNPKLFGTTGYISTLTR
jgi:hypothetical protein